MRVPNIEQSEAILNEAENINPGLWAAHSRSAAVNAKHIAAAVCAKGIHIDTDAAYVMGLLHDIGRREGFTHMRHILDGFKFLSGLGFDDAAYICLSHSFPIKDINTAFGILDFSADELKFVQDYLGGVEYTIYDKLIQLCDVISMPQGAVLMEKRMIDVASRHGLPYFSLDKWRSYFLLKQYFDELCSCNIYSLLPGIIDNTFEFK